MANNYTWSFVGQKPHLGKMIKGEPYSGVISEEHATEIGAILILWNQYQSAFAILYRAIYAFAKVDAKEWKKLDHQQQCTFLAQTLDRAFSKPNFVKFICDDLVRSKDIADKRNALAHGKYEWGARLDGDVMTPILRTIREYKKSWQTLEFSVEDLTNLRLQVSNLAGRLNSIVNVTSSDTWLRSALPSDDISLLQQIFSKPI